MNILWSQNIVTLHKWLSHDKSSFYAHVTARLVWQFALRKISPSQDPYFGHINGKLIWGQTELRRW